MKSKYITFCILAASLTSACSDSSFESRDTDFVQSPERRIYINASIEDPSTRVSIDDNKVFYSFAWEDNDHLSIFPQSSSSVIQCDIVQGTAGLKKATFVSDVKFNTGETLYALYNGNQPISKDEAGNVILDISDQDGTLTDKYQYMLGEATYNGNDTISFTMKHLVASLKLNITLPEGIEAIDYVEFGTPHNRFYRGDLLVPEATLVIDGAENDSEGMFSRGDLVYNHDHEEYYEGSLVINRRFVPQSGSRVVTVYMYILPPMQYWDNYNRSENTYAYSTIYVKSGDKEFVGNIDYKRREIFSGDAFEINTGLYELENFSNEGSADGSQTLPYEIANERQLYTYMFRSSTNRRNSVNRYYNECYYNMLKDMELNQELPWVPCYLLDHNIFDGKNHEIKGKVHLNGPLFSVIDQHSTLKNLIFNPTEVSSAYYAGSSLFVNQVSQGSSIYHCLNKADLPLYCWSMSVFAYIIIDESSIVACGNEGTIYASGGQCGALVNRLVNKSVMNACYNKGNFIFDYDSYYQYAGLTNSVSDSEILNSWTRCNNVVSANGSPISSQDYVLENERSAINNCFCVIDIPSPDQIKALNDFAIFTGYIFDNDGSLILNKSSVVVPSVVEDWK